MSESCLLITANFQGGFLVSVYNLYLGRTVISIDYKRDGPGLCVGSVDRRVLYGLRLDPCFLWPQMARPVD